MLACKHLHSRIYSTSIHDNFCIHQGISIAKTEEICSLINILVHNGVDHIL